MKYFIAILALLTIALFETGKFKSKEIFSNKQDGFNVLDSLRKFDGGRDTLLLDDASDATLFIGTANKKSYGVYVVSEKTLAFYQKRNRDWEMTEKLPYENLFSYAEAKDINGDKMPDVRVACFSGMSGNTENTVFLYDKRSGIFKHNESYDRPNVAYDQKGKFVRSSWFSGAVHCQNKYKYRIAGDSLTFERGIIFCPDQETGQTGTLVEYTYKDGQRIALDSISGNAATLFDKFEKTFWNSEHDLY